MRCRFFFVCACMRPHSDVWLLGMHDVSKMKSFTILKNGTILPRFLSLIRNACHRSPTCIQRISVLQTDLWHCHVSECMTSERFTCMLIMWTLSRQLHSSPSRPILCSLTTMSLVWFVQLCIRFVFTLVGLSYSVKSTLL